jgi:hypothetical protein
MQAGKLLGTIVLCLMAASAHAAGFPRAPHIREHERPRHQRRGLVPLLSATRRNRSRQGHPAGRELELEAGYRNMQIKVFAKMPGG